MVGAISTSSVQSSALRYIPQSTNDSGPATGAVDTANIVTSRIRVDNLQNVAILEYISSQGQVVQQYPSPAQIRAFKRAEQLQAEQQQQAAQQHAQQQQQAAPAPQVQQAAPSASAAPVQQATAAPVSTSSVPTTSFSINTASVVAQSAPTSSSQSVLV